MFVLGAPSFRFLDRQIKLLRKEKVKLKNKKYCPGSDFASLILSLHSHSQAGPTVDLPLFDTNCLICFLCKFTTLVTAANFSQSSLSEF